MQVSSGSSLNLLAKSKRPAARPGGGRRVLEGAFALLEAVERASEAGLTRLAADSGLPKATAYRLLEQLVELGAVARSSSPGGYRIGPQIFRLGQAWQPFPGLRAAAAGPIRSLAAATGLTVGLGVLSEGRVLVIVGVPGAVRPQAVRPGTAWPLSTAVGQALVAGGNPGVPLDSLPTSWRHTAAAIRERGLAFDREQVGVGVCCVATPVYAPDGKTVAALGALTDPSHRMARLAAPVLRAGQLITAGLRKP